MKNQKKILQSEPETSFAGRLIRQYWFAGLVMLALLVKYFLIQGIPLVAKVNNIHDHRLMVNIAADILNGDWLGGIYINRHMAKGCGYPLLIAIQNLLGLSVRQMAWMLYSTGCLLMVCAVRPIVKSRLLQLFFFCVLLFCPFFDMSIIYTYRF